MPQSVPRNWAHPALILVATDISDLDRLMPPAIEQAKATGARLILLHVLATLVVSADAAGLPYYDTAGAFETAGRLLEPRCEVARRFGIRCDALVREGDPAQQIAVAIRQFQADRVLLGTRSRSRLGRLFLGSVAEQVLRSVNLPVFTVGPEAHLQEANAAAGRVVLLATTLRETSRPSAALACQIASEQNARLVLLHVLPPVDEMARAGLPTGLDSAAMRELQLLAAETGAARSTAVDLVVAHGNPCIEILAEAVQRHASLIVLGATQRSAFENLVRDRTIYRVLAHALCPVLTLREPRPAPAEASAERVAARH